jgi:pimeloyl-ACP methyl ester carboxylesterase
VNGPPGFADFHELLARTIEYNPGRSEASLRRGVLHNAIQREDGTWSWRWALHRHEASEVPPETSSMWELLEHLEIPITLLRGMGPGSVVDDADVAKLRSISDAVTVIEVEGAGHSIQGDQPLILADIIRSLS